MGVPLPPGRQSAGARQVAVEIVQTLREAGHVAYFAGGCVRDELLGLTPTDYDVATDATPDRVSSLFRRTAHVGAHFGVVLVKGARVARGGEDPVVEVATFRSEGAYSDRRRPDRVTFSDARADAQRRDFTVNALFLDPLKPGPISEQVVDLVGGLADLAARVLRAVGNPDERLAEDHLRALRAVRLSARLGFRIDAATAAAIHRHARELTGVSRERVGEEMRRILGHPSRATAVGVLQDLGLDAPVLGGEKPGAGVTRLGGLAETAPMGACLGAIALDRGDVVEREDVQRVLGRWRETLCLSNEEREEARGVLGAVFVVREEFLGAPVARQKRAAVGAGFEWALEIVGAEDEGRAAAVRARVAALRATASGLGPSPLVTGDDLIRSGMSPGRRFAGLLAALYDAQLEDRFASKEEGLRLAREIASREQ